jgi:hypothetical protein
MTERPDRYRNSIVPHIYVDGASDAIAFYKRAFGAVELFRIAHPNGKILHAEISICGSVVMIGDPDDRLYAEPRVLESVRKHQAGLQSFLSMRRIEARRRNASALRLRFSQSLASLRQRLSQAMVRSTIQRLGNTTNPLA